MEQRNKQLSVAELVSAILPQMEGKSYAARYISDIQRVYRHLQEYCKITGETEYSAELG